MEKFSNNDDEKRIRMVIMLDKILNDTIISKKIEKSIYNHTIQVAKERNMKRSWNNSIFNNLYDSKIRSIYTNLKSDSYVNNKEFLKKIKSKEISVDKIGSLSVYDIYPENWKELMDVKLKRDKIKYELKPEAMTTLFKCRKCNSRETSYYEVQTRSADEPMTQFITCLNCNNRWKM